MTAPASPIPTPTPRTPATATDIPLVDALRPAPSILATEPTGSRDGAAAPIPVSSAGASSATVDLKKILSPPTIITTSVSPTSTLPGSSPLSIASDRSTASAPAPLPPPTAASAALRAAARGPRGPQDFRYGQILGEGSYSTVVEAWDLLSDPKTPQAQAAAAAAAAAAAGTLSASSSYSSLRNRSRASSSASIGAAAAAAAAGLSSPSRGANMYAQSPESAASAIVKENSAVDTAGKRVYAIKILHKAHIVKEKKHKYVGIEKEALSRLTRAPGIITLYWTFQDRESLYFVLALAPNGELLSHIKTLGSFSTASTRFYGAQLLDALRSIHEAGIIHRDVKPENVLFDKEMRIKITDFGSAKILSPSSSSSASASAAPAPHPSSLPNTSSTTTRPVLLRTGDLKSGRPGDTATPAEKPSSFVGTAEYVSPELLLSRSVSFASDWWAYGCIVFQMLCGRPPFKGPTEYQTFQRILHRDLEWPLEVFEPEGDDEATKAERQELADARGLIEQLLVLAPEERLGYVSMDDEDTAPTPTQATGPVNPFDTPPRRRSTDAASEGARAIRAQNFFKAIRWETLWTCPVPTLEAGRIAPRVPLSTPMSQLEYEFGDAAFFEEDEEDEDEETNSEGSEAAR
ncbi:serine/threonine protein kinase [Tilletia horrida]|nr:serine/threonine protein kinase [Tilletia horrida]